MKIKLPKNRKLIHIRDIQKRYNRNYPNFSMIMRLTNLTHQQVQKCQNKLNYQTEKKIEEF